MKKVLISCNACGANNFQTISTVEEWNIGRCRECGLIYLNPAPFFEPTNEFSEMSKGFQYTRYMHEKITPRIFAYETEQLKNHQKEVLRLTGKTLPDNVKYLEVGCGSGASVKSATDLGWKAVGIDIDPELIGTGKEQHGADLRCGTLLNVGFEKQSFDFIRLRDVIEHLPNPYEIMLEIKRLLRPGGICLIVAPNEAAMVNRIRYSLGFKHKMVAYAEPPHHIHGFDTKTLKMILKRVDFNILMTKTTIPADPEYVTSNNMRSANQITLVSLWKLARTIGMGNFLVAWIQKK